MGWTKPSPVQPMGRSFLTENYGLDQAVRFFYGCPWAIFYIKKSKNFQNMPYFVTEFFLKNAI